VSLDGHPLLLTFYGDDFTGSTDVLEALTLRGIDSVLFLEPPSDADRALFPQARAIGIAGMSRSQPPEWMDEHLPAVFEWLRALGAPWCHYKLCSTFDSSPSTGSIGRAIEIGRRVFGNDCVPLVVGAPILRRYVVFGNLFATAQGETHRIDRHPTMSRHPVTPMTEGDLRRHLASQTPLATGLIDALCLASGGGLARWRELSGSTPIVLFDTLDASHLRETGRVLWEARPTHPAFVAGSSGVEYALLSWWESQGWLPPEPPVRPAGAVDRLLVVSGSCSPVTAGQIAWALDHGFAGVAIDPRAMVAGELEFARVLERCGQELSRGRSVVAYSAAGPEDVVPGNASFGPALGARLGALTAELARQQDLRRLVIAGGDTSGHAGRALEILALTVVRPFAPGSPLCRIRSRQRRWDGCEVLLKGGQVGSERLFGEVRAGEPHFK
jgi:uncharacterized protein YgbK (DUF1537 family)